MGVRASLLELYNPLMASNPQAAANNIGLPGIGQVLAASATTTSSETVTLAAPVPSWVVAGMEVFDTTSNLLIGTVGSVSGSTITLSADASHAIAAGDVLQLGLTPADINAAQLVSTDIRGVIETIQLRCSEAIQLLQFLTNDAVTSGVDSATFTLLNNQITALS